MKCPKCEFVSFDNLQECRKCGMRITTTTFDVTPSDSKGKNFSSNSVHFNEKDFNRTLEEIKRDLDDIEKKTGKDTSRYDDISPANTTRIHTAPKIQTKPSQNYAGFFIRLVAYTIDNVVLSVISCLLFVAAYVLMRSDTGSMFEPVTFLRIMYVPLLITTTIIEGFYFTYFHAVTGQTVGKMICRIQVLGQDGNILGFKGACMRMIGYVLSRLSFYIGFLWIAIDKQKQGWHDKIARSYVKKL